MIANASRVLNLAESNYFVAHFETLAVVWIVNHFRDIIFGYLITVYLDRSAVTELFKGKNLTGKVVRWYCTIQECVSKFIYLPGGANVVADELSHNAPVGAIHESTLVANFTFQQLEIAQQNYDVWIKVIYALKTGDDSSLLRLPIPLSEYFLSIVKVLFRYWPQKTNLVEQFVWDICSCSASTCS